MWTQMFLNKCIQEQILSSFSKKSRKFKYKLTEILYIKSRIYDLF